MFELGQLTVSLIDFLPFRNSRQIFKIKNNEGLYHVRIHHAGHKSKLYFVRDGYSSDQLENYSKLDTVFLLSLPICFLDLSIF
jgi:hypothetical protein